jgi:integrase
MSMLGNDIGRITRDSLNDFRNFMHAANLSPASMRLEMAGARSFTSWLVDGGHDLPALREPKMPRPKLKAPPALSGADMARVCAYAAEHVPQPYAAAIEFLWLTGMRVDELCHLEIAQLRFERDAGATGGGLFVFRGVVGKSKAVRDVYIADNAAVRRYYGVRKSLPWYTPESPWMFPARDGTAIKKRHVQKYIRDIRGPLGYPELTAHVFRHHWATQASAAGVDEFTIQAHLGHESIMTTSRYVHVSDAMKRAAHRAIQANRDGDRETP